MILSFLLLPNLFHISMLTFSIKSLIVITILYSFSSIFLIEEDHIKSTINYTLFPLKLLTHPLFPLDMPTKLKFFPFFFPTNFPHTLYYGNILPLNATTLGLKLAFITSLMEWLPDAFYNTPNLCFRNFFYCLTTNKKILSFSSSLSSFVFDFLDHGHFIKYYL